MISFTKSWTISKSVQSFWGKNGIPVRFIYNFIMVAGCKDESGDPDYRRITNLRINQLAANNKTQEMKFYVFDFSKFRSFPKTGAPKEDPKQLKLEVYQLVSDILVVLIFQNIKAHLNYF